MILKRIKNLWTLSAMEISSDVFRKVVLEIPQEEQKKHRRLATIIEISPPDYFKHDKTDQ